MEDFGEFFVDEVEFWYWFSTLNHEVFGGAVPPPDLIDTCDEDTFPDSWAYIKTLEYEEKLIVGLYIKEFYPNKAFFVNVLAHEMIHIWQLKVNGDSGKHNRHFYSWRDTFEKHGLFLRRCY